MSVNGIALISFTSYSQRFAHEAARTECVRLFGQDTRKNTRTMSIVCLGRSGCLSVWLSACLAGWLAGWLVCLSVSVWVCLGLDLSGSVWVWSVSVCLGLSGSVWVCLSVSVCLCLCLGVKNHMRLFPPKNIKSHMPNTIHLIQSD